MEFETAQALFDRALGSEYGIAVVYNCPSNAQRQRRRLYAEREKIRRAGICAYDCLSLIVREGELHIIKREALLTPALIDALRLRSLKPGEVPQKIFSRGKSRPFLSIP